MPYPSEWAYPPSMAILEPGKLHWHAGFGFCTLTIPTYNFAMMVHPNFPSTFQFVKEIRREFGLDKPPRSFSDALDEFQEFLLTEHTRGKPRF